MLRSSQLAVLSISTLFAVACSPQESSDAEGNQGSAQTARGELLTACPALEGVELTASVVGDAGLLVKQEYTLASFSSGGQLVPGQRVTTAQTPSTNYNLRFYRDAQGRSKFQLRIGTWYGMDASIDGNVKSAVVSGTIAPDDETSAGPTAGTLRVTSRRESFESLAGDVSELSFDQLDCRAGEEISVTLPIVTLDKTSDELVDVQDGAGRTLRVTPKVRWGKKADSAPLRFHAVKG